MEKEKIQRLLRSAGKNFFALHIEDILDCFPELDSSRDFKDAKIKAYFSDQVGFFSKDEEGVRVRINAILQIVRANAVDEALEMVGTGDPRILPEAELCARELLRRRTGEKKVPHS